MPELYVLATRLPNRSLRHYPLVTISTPPKRGPGQLEEVTLLVAFPNWHTICESRPNGSFATTPRFRFLNARLLSRPKEPWRQCYRRLKGPRGRPGTTSLAIPPSPVPLLIPGLPGVLRVPTGPSSSSARYPVDSDGHLVTPTGAGHCSPGPARYGLVSSAKGKTRGRSHQRPLV